MNNQALINDGLNLLDKIHPNKPTAIGPTAVAHRIHSTPQLSATLNKARELVTFYPVMFQRTGEWFYKTERPCHLGGQEFIITDFSY